MTYQFQDPFTGYLRNGIPGNLQVAAGPLSVPRFIAHALACAAPYEYQAVQIADGILKPLHPHTSLLNKDR
ncbi:hypothetical protein HHJ44_19990 [Escherichia coli]|nr:hypothetical protein HHJ44_19990 [Escherichia coli]